MQFIDKLLGIDKLKAELKSFQSTTSVQLFNQVYPSWHTHKYIEAFRISDIVNSVVNKLSNTAAALPIYGYNVNMEDLPETDKLVIFLRSLTFIQKKELYTWLFLADECFIYKDKTLGVNGTVNNVYFLNPSFVTLVISDSFPQEVAYYIYKEPMMADKGIRIELDEMVFIHGFNPTTDRYLKWRGLSKVEVLKYKLTRLESNIKNSVGQLQNGGVPGVVYQKDLKPNEQAKSVLGPRQDNFANFLKNPDNKGAPYFAAGEMGYIQIGSSLVDMDSIELEKADNKSVCNVWGLSDVLLNSDSAATESNVKEMIRQMYTNAVMPYTRMVDDAFNNDLVTDFGVGFRQVKTDYSDVHELQSSLKEKVDALAAAPVMIPNDVLEAMGYDRVDNPDMDLPLIKSGYEPIDNFEPLPPVE